MQYVLDSNIFIQAKNDAYPMQFFPGVWSWLSEGIAGGQLLLIKPVYDELRAGNENDELTQWVRQHQTDVFTLESPEYWAALKEVAGFVNGRFPQIRATEFLKVADPQLIAYAKAMNATVITNEVDSPGSKKPKIPTVCYELGVKCRPRNELFTVLHPEFVLKR